MEKVIPLEIFQTFYEIKDLPGTVYITIILKGDKDPLYI